MSKTRAGRMDLYVSKQYDKVRPVEPTGRKPWKFCDECAGRYRAGQKAGHVAAGHQDWFEAK